MHHVSILQVSIRQVLQGMRACTSENRWELLNDVGCRSVAAPTLLVIRDSAGHIFGSFTSEGWRVATRFYGTGETFVFQLQVIELESVKLTQHLDTACTAMAVAASCCQLSILTAVHPNCSRTKLRGGGGARRAMNATTTSSSGRPSPWRSAAAATSPSSCRYISNFHHEELEEVPRLLGDVKCCLIHVSVVAPQEDLLRGSSGISATFGNPCLAGSSEFAVGQLEVWAVMPT